LSVGGFAASNDDFDDDRDEGWDEPVYVNIEEMKSQMRRNPLCPPASKHKGTISSKLDPRKRFRSKTPRAVKRKRSRIQLAKYSERLKQGPYQTALEPSQQGANNGSDDGGNRDAFGECTFL